MEDINVVDAVNNGNGEANQAVAIQVDDGIVPVAVEMEDINVVDAVNNGNGEANQAVAIQVDDAIVPVAVDDDYDVDVDIDGDVHEMALADDHVDIDDGGESAGEEDDEDEAGDVIMEENESADDSVETESGEESNEVGGSGGIGVQEFNYWQQFCVNKPVLWDLEAPSLGYHFERFSLAESDRNVIISSDLEEYEELMEYIIDVDLMSHLSNKEAQARVKERLELFQQRKIKYQDLKEHMDGTTSDFRKCLERLHSEWNEERLDRALVNYLLRMGYIDTAYKFALKRKMQDFFDFKKFRKADLIVKALRNKDLHPAKVWCNTNAPLSKLGIELFCQEYIEIVRTNQNMNAIEFAWNHQEVLSEIDQSVWQVLAVAAFGRDTSVLRYKKLFDDERWDILIELFWKNFIKSQWFTNDASSLCILLESGITALKVPFCFDGEDCKKVDPLKHEPFSTFASILPHARHHFPPKLLCHVTKQPLGQQNPPHMLPNGYAYSKQAILGMTNGDEVTCPRTGFVCKISDLRILNLVGYP